MSFFLVLIVQTVILIPLSHAYTFKVTIETSKDEGNEETNVYLVLLGVNDQKISGEKRLGKFDEGEVREFVLTAWKPEVTCLKFTLKDGTDGWTMQRTTIVSENGATFTFENEDMEKLDNTIPWFQENSLKFCKKSRANFELVNESGKNETEEREGLLLFNGGTVCDDMFGEWSARAVCRAMGRPSTNVTVKSYPGKYLYGTVQTGKKIKLDKVKCTTDNWFQCSFSTAHQCKHEEDVFLTCGGRKESGLSTVVTTVIIAVAAVVSIALIVCLAIFCKRRKKVQQPESAAEALRPEQAAPSAPSAPPQYDLEMAPSAPANNEALPSYDEVVNAPNRFNFRGSSFRKLSGYFSRNHNDEKI